MGFHLAYFALVLLLARCFGLDPRKGSGLMLVGMVLALAGSLIGIFLVEPQISEINLHFSQGQTPPSGLGTIKSVQAFEVISWAYLVYGTFVLCTSQEQPEPERQESPFKPRS